MRRDAAMAAQGQQQQQGGEERAGRRGGSSKVVEPELEQAYAAWWRELGGDEKAGHDGDEKVGRDGDEEARPGRQRREDREYESQDSGDACSRASR